MDAKEDPNIPWKMLKCAKNMDVLVCVPYEMPIKGHGEKTGERFSGRMQLKMRLIWMRSKVTALPDNNGLAWVYRHLNIKGMCNMQQAHLLKYWFNFLDFPPILSNLEPLLFVCRLWWPRFQYISTFSLKKCVSLICLCFSCSQLYWKRSSIPFAIRSTRFNSNATVGVEQ